MQCNNVLLKSSILSDDFAWWDNIRFPLNDPGFFIHRESQPQLKKDL